MTCLLPILILEMIIDQVNAEEDPNVLATFALVCRDLVVRSRFCLYHTLHLKTVGRLDLICKSLTMHPFLLN